MYRGRARRYGAKQTLKEWEKAGTLLPVKIYVVTSISINSDFDSFRLQFWVLVPNDDCFESFLVEYSVGQLRALFGSAF